MVCYVSCSVSFPSPCKVKWSEGSEEGSLQESRCYLFPSSDPPLNVDASKVHMTSLSLLSSIPPTLSLHQPDRVLSQSILCSLKIDIQSQFPPPSDEAERIRPLWQASACSLVLQQAKSYNHIFQKGITESPGKWPRAMGAGTSGQAEVPS